MGVIVKGMVTPEDCCGCEMFYDDCSKCCVTGNYIPFDDAIAKGRPDDCPLEEAFDHELLQHVEYTSEQMGYDK